MKVSHHGVHRRHSPQAIIRAAGMAARLMAIPALLLPAILPAHALSEIKREDLPAPAATDDAPAPETSVPIPAPVGPAQDADPETTGPMAPGGIDDPEASPEPDAAQSPDDDEPVPDVQYDVTTLPEPVQRLRGLIIEACKTGDIERLRPLIGLGDDQAQLSVTDVDGDPIEHLKGLAGDEGGQEILAILEEVLSAGFVHLDPGTPEEIYVWPYFFAVPLATLTPPQKVELFKIVTAGDYEEMKNFGAYIFYRVGITPEGRWAFFVAGE